MEIEYLEGHRMINAETMQVSWYVPRWPPLIAMPQDALDHFPERLLHYDPDSQLLRVWTINDLHIYRYVDRLSQDPKVLVFEDVALG